MPEPTAPTRDKDLHRSLFGAACRSIQPIILNVLSVPAMAFIIRKLGASNYGYWTTATSLVATTAVLTSLGLRGTFIRGVAQDPSSAPAAFAEQLGTRIILSLMAVAITMIACLSLGYPMVILQCTAIAASGVVLSTIWTTGNDLLEAFQRLPATAGISMISGLLVTAASVAAIAVGAGPVGLSFAYLLGPLSFVLILWLLLHREHFPIRATFHPGRAVRLLWTSRHFSAQQLLAAASANIALLMLPKLVGAASFGLFSAGVLLVTRVAIFPDAIGTAFYPLIAKSIQKDRRLARRHALLALGLALVTCLCVAIPIMLLSGTIARILFPQSAIGCQRVIAITIWALPLIGIETVIGYALNAVGKEATQARNAFLAAIVSLTAGSVIVWQSGIWGACAYMLIRPTIGIAFNLRTFVTTFTSPAKQATSPQRTAGLNQSFISGPLST